MPQVDLDTPLGQIAAAFGVAAEDLTPEQVEGILKVTGDTYTAGFSAGINAMHENRAATANNMPAAPASRPLELAS